MAFKGFPTPKQNYSKLPHAFIDSLPEIETVSELKVVLYLIRHTWGYSEYGKPKRITTDEFMRGRKRRDGSRIDAGTGLSNNSVIDGLKRALSHNFVLVESDASDLARIEKRYCLNISGMQTLHSYPQELHSSYAEVAQRSEKETLVIQEEEGLPPQKSLFSIYEEEIGLLTPLIADALEDWREHVPERWIIDAIREAARANARSWKYVEAILKRWKAQGNQEPVKKPSRTGSRKSVEPVPNEDPAVLERARTAAASADWSIT